MAGKVYRVSRFIMGTLLNAGLLRAGSALKEQAYVWQWVLGALVVAGLCVVPILFLANERPGSARLSEVAIRSAVSWVLGGALLMWIVYSDLGRLPGPAFATALGILFSIGGAIFGWISWTLYKAFWRKRERAS